MGKPTPLGNKYDRGEQVDAADCLTCAPKRVDCGIGKSASLPRIGGALPRAVGG